MRKREALLSKPTLIIFYVCCFSLGIAGSDYKQSLQFRNLNEEKENIRLSVSSTSHVKYVSQFLVSELQELLMSFITVKVLRAITTWHCMQLRLTTLILAIRS